MVPVRIHHHHGPGSEFIESMAHAQLKYKFLKALLRGFTSVLDDIPLADASLPIRIIVYALKIPRIQRHIAKR